MNDLRKAAGFTKPGAIVPVDLETTALLVNALRQALAQPEQEPVVGMFEEKLPDQNPSPWVRDYKPKREWVGLTDKEITKIGNLDWDSAYVGIWYDFAKAIEAKLKEKNT